MDAVRFGRALGIGARQAAKTVVSAVDAATADNPSSRRAAMPSSRPAVAAPVRPTGDVPKAAKTAARAVVQGRQATRGLQEGRKRFGEAAWRPFVRLGGVLWLEVVGVFFGMFAMFALTAVWRLRGEWHTKGAAHTEFVWSAAMFAVFGYFCVSNFIRARKRERQH